MNYLLAKVKRKTNLFRVLSTQQNIFNLPVLDDCLAYNPATLLDEEQWYTLADFSDSQYCTDFFKNDFDSVNHIQITNDDASKMSYLCSVQNSNYFFQVINSSLLIRRKWFALDELSIEADRPIVTINNDADAIYDKVNDVLYFKKLSTANSIFKGIDQLYREATNVETETFLQSDFLRMMNNFDSNAVKVPNRKRIALVMDTLNGYNDQQRTDIFTYMQGYIQVPFVNNAFEIETEEHLKHILYGIEQRFYTTQLGNERRIANSIITIA
ncbi:MAG: hypothetical protein WC716_15230 [Chitinophagaceae bacterium]|jgi:hypothetical protein